MDTDLLKSNGIIETILPEKFIFADKVIEELIKRADKIARTNATVLIFGETGVGKTALARYIHSLSGRTGNFVPITDAVVNSSMAESLLFGHKKGSFTGAMANHDGLLTLANGGTIFIDEFADISKTVQAKLLPVIDSRIYESQHIFFRLGSNSPVVSDFRVIASTNRKLEGSWLRKDLLYRLNQVEFFIPPLRQRPEDLKALTYYFLDEAGKILNRQMQITKGAMEILSRYDWPGNIRELKNVLFAVCALSDKENLEAIDFENILKKNPVPGMLIDEFATDVTMADLRKSFGKVKVRKIKETLATTKYNVKQAAEILGIDNSSLWKLIKQLGIEILPKKLLKS